MTGERKSQIIKALPYNAAAKPIEGWFGRFEQQYLRHCPGWRDDDPMNPARPKMGKFQRPSKAGLKFSGPIFRALARL